MRLKIISLCLKSFCGGLQTKVINRNTRNRASLWGDLKNRIMNKNTRKFIWHILWGFMFLGGAILMLAVADSLWYWALFGINVILSAIHFQKAEQTLKED